MEVMLYLTENRVVLYSLIGFLTLVLIFLLIIKHKKETKQNKKLSDELIEMVTGDSDAADEDKKEDLTNLLEKMQKDVEIKENKVDTFEHEQEENSIISYQELLDANRKLRDQLNKKEDTEQVVKKEQILQEEYDTKFQNTDFISPVYGKIEPNLEYQKVKKIERDDSINNDDFLESLKEFRSKLN